MLLGDDKLSIGTLLKRFPKKVIGTWTLTLFETALLAAMPLAIGWSIDGLIEENYRSFGWLVGIFVVILIIAIGRRVYDTRAYGTIRVEMGKAQVDRTCCDDVSVTNARVFMGRELVDFLEVEAPIAMTAVVQVIVSVIILLTFHSLLAVSAAASVLVVLVVYSLFSNKFFQLNAELNEQSEGQIKALESNSPKTIAAYFVGLRRKEVALSDTESVVYGIIFAILMTMLGFNLWFAATQLGASTGTIFAVVTYSFQFLESSVTLPAALQSMTRLREITERINRSDISDESGSPATTAE